MKTPANHYPQALVPEHLTKLTIETLPFDKAFFISPGELDDYEEPTMFVTSDRRLKMSKSSSIDVADLHPGNPAERVGIMRIPIIGDEGSSVGEAYIADLRFIGFHQLVDTNDATMGIMDQEEFMAWSASIENAVEISGFIAADNEFKINKDISQGIFYGDPILYPHLEILRRKSDTTLERFKIRRSKVLKAKSEKSSQKSKEKQD